MFQVNLKRVKRLLAIVGGLLLITGCTSSDSMVQSVRPLYQTQGEVATTGEKGNYAQGKHYYAQGHYGLALDAFQAELRLNKRSVRALNGIAACYDQLKRYDLALSYYYKALQIQPDSAQTLGNLGYSFIMQERYEEAERMLHLALQHDPGNERAKRHLALIEDKNRSIAEAPAPAAQVENENAARPSEEAVAALPPAPAVQPVETNSETEGVAAVVESVAPSDQAAVASEVTVPEKPKAASEQAVVVRAAERDAAVAAIPAKSEMEASDKGDGKGVLQAVSGLFRSIGDTIVGIFSPSASEQSATAVAVVEKVEPIAPEAPAGIVPAGEVADTGKAAADLPAPVEEIATAPAEALPLQPSEEVVDTQQGNSQEIAVAPAETVAEVDTVAPVETAVEMAPAPIIAEREKIEVSNGNGSPGNANLVAIYLKAQGERVWRITNADSFTYDQSVILYRSGNRLAAERLANKLPLGVMLQESVGNYPGIAARLVLGQEMVPYRAAIEKALREHQQAELYASNYSFGNDTPVAIAIEISNGNGSEGMARLLRDVLAKKGQKVARVTNAESFDHDRTVIYYQPGELHDASRVASELPVEVKLEEADISHRNVKMRIIMGKDFINFKAAMELLVDKDV